VKDFHRRKVDISALVREVVLNPKATPPLIAEVVELLKNSGYAIPVNESALAQYSKFLPF
jgi:hypothetical protein